MSRRISLIAVAIALFVSVIPACSRSDEDTQGGGASATIPPFPNATSGGGPATAPTGASGVSGAVGESGTAGAGDTTNVIDVIAEDHRFEMPARVAPGDAAFVLRNEGTEPHELVLFALDPGKTLRDVRTVIDGGVPKQPPSWVRPLGGTFAKPGKTSKPLEATLEAGRTYVMACFVTTEQGVTHAQLGMVREVPLATT